MSRKGLPNKHGGKLEALKDSHRIIKELNKTNSQLNQIVNGMAVAVDNLQVEMREAKLGFKIINSTIDLLIEKGILSHDEISDKIQSDQAKEHKERNPEAHSGGSEGDTTGEHAGVLQDPVSSNPVESGSEVQTDSPVENRTSNSVAVNL